jgi:hypothetical protein
MIYEIKGWTTGGWNVEDKTTSLREAKRIAKVTMGGFCADSGSHCVIRVNGHDLLKWSGTTNGKWMRVTV